MTPLERQFLEVFICLNFYIGCYCSEVWAVQDTFFYWYCKFTAYGQLPI